MPQRQADVHKQHLLRARLRPAGLRVDRVVAEHPLPERVAEILRRAAQLLEPLPDYFEPCPMLTLLINVSKVSSLRMTLQFRFIQERGGLL